MVEGCFVIGPANGVLPAPAVMRGLFMSKAASSLIKLVVFTLIVGGLYVMFIHEDRVVLPPGVRAANEPVQFNIDPLVVYEDDDHQITAVAEFSLQAKVLGRKRYRTGQESSVSPLDLAMGWQRMSDQSVVDEIDISQHGRWYTWRTDSLPIPLRDIERCSANMHMIPKDDRVRKKLLAVRTGEIVFIEGYLVNVWASDNWTWNTSTTRDDTGGGACEIIWVETFEVVETE